MAITTTHLFDLLSQTPNIDLKEKELDFFAVGVGAKGLNEYAFLLNLYSEVVPEVGITKFVELIIKLICFVLQESFYKITDRNVEFVLKKKILILWPRLLENVSKPQWLKVDFDRIKQEDLDTTSDSEVDEVARNRGTHNPRFMKDRNFGRGRRNRGTFFAHNQIFF